jgi:hypothetical protein
LSLNIILFFAFVALLLVGLGWGLRRPRKRRKLPVDPRSLEVTGQRHAAHLPQIRQALAATDYDFLAKEASREVERRVRRERRAVALAYLAALREDFQNLLRMARVIAVLSPEVAASQEFETMRLMVKFSWRYEMIRWMLLADIAPLPQLHGLSDLVSGLSVRIEAALRELGERAAVAAELASSVNRRGLDVV